MGYTADLPRGRRPVAAPVAGVGGMHTATVPLTGTYHRHQPLHSRLY